MTSSDQFKELAGKTVVFKVQHLFLNQVRMESLAALLNAIAVFNKGVLSQHGGGSVYVGGLVEGCIEIHATANSTEELGLLCNELDLLGNGYIPDGYSRIAKTGARQIRNWARDFKTSVGIITPTSKSKVALNEPVFEFNENTRIPNTKEEEGKHTYTMIESELYGTLTQLTILVGGRFNACQITSEEDGVVSCKFLKPLTDKVRKFAGEGVRVVGDSIHSEETHKMESFMIEGIERFEEVDIIEFVENLREGTGNYYSKLSYKELETEIRELRND